MRWVVFTIFALLATATMAQEPASNRGTQPRNQLPAATAEPENAAAYAPPTPRENAGPSAADRGPAQRPFILASQTDNVGAEDNPPTVSNAPPEKIALDRKVQIRLVHDVDNDGKSKTSDEENHALAYEIKYINFGAVTQEQLEARRGHYFTISWCNKGPRADFRVQFQYRQVKTEGIVRTLEEKMPAVRGTVRSYFGVVDRAYLTYGPVASWKLSIFRGDTVVAETRSFIW